MKNQKTSKHGKTFLSEDQWSEEIENVLDALVTLAPEVLDRVYATAKQPQFEKQMTGFDKSPKSTKICACDLKNIDCVCKNENIKQAIVPPIDHDFVWLWQGKPLYYIGHEYPMHLDKIKKLVQYCEKWDLEIMMSAQSLWFPSRTVEICIYDRDRQTAYMTAKRLGRMH